MAKRAPVFRGGGTAGGRAARTLAGLCALLAASAAADCIEVIAHRGASGYLPEHTLPAYALGYGQGAGWIEPDVVLTADGVPVALHDVILDQVTDVAEVFPDRAREDGRHHVADFSYAEIRRLRVRDAVEGRFPHRTFRVPRLREVLELVDGLNRTTRRRVGVYPELKEPAAQPGLAAAVLEALAGYDLPVILQSFDAAALAALRTDHPRVQLIDEDVPLADAELDAIAGYAVGVGVPKKLLFEDATAAPRARARRLAVHVWTLRADRVGEGFDSFAAEVAALAGLGVDGMFTDHPDRVRALLGAAACGAAPD